MYLIICGARSADKMLKMLKTSRIKLVIEEASFQAGGRSFLASSPVNVGMNAEDNAPPATRLKIKLGYVEAA